jgi:hypothetical protein
MDFTCVIGMICLVLSSPARVTSVGELALTVPVRVVPSRIKILRV